MRIHLLFSLALALLLGASASYAQADLEADVPFDFHAGKRVLPADTYNFDIDNAGLIWIGNETGTRSIVGSIGVGGRGFDHESKLVFNRYGDNYFLSEMWSEVTATGRRIKRTPTEEELARNMPAKPVTLRASSR